MVHALQEIWRVLVPQGILIDLRPFMVYPPVEVIHGEQIILAGLTDDSGGHLDDLAANAAVAQLLDAGRFVLEREMSFDFCTYWDTPAEMKAYTDTYWNTCVLPDGVLATTKRLMSQHSDRARVRVRRNVNIARHRKPASPVHNA